MTKLPVHHPYASEAIRLHVDWWGKCRTCKWWDPVDAQREAVSWDERGALTGICRGKKSVLFDVMTGPEGDCVEWDSYDVDAAIVVMEMVG